MQDIFAWPRNLYNAIDAYIKSSDDIYAPMNSTLTCVVGTCKFYITPKDKEPIDVGVVVKFPLEDFTIALDRTCLCLDWVPNAQTLSINTTNYSTNR